MGVMLTGGVEIPQIGFGTLQIRPDETQAAVEGALALGYRHVDTAAAYMNEAGVGAALAATGLAGEVFVTTKLRTFEQGYDPTLRAFEASRAALGVDVVDLYLIHWPAPALGTYVDSWRAMARLLEEGAVRAIGVSNFLPEHIARLADEVGVLPAVDQVESHPSFWRPELEACCRERGIVVEAYAPLGHGGDLAAGPVVAAADRVGASPAQVILGWHLRSGRVVLPKSAHEARMRENLAAAEVAPLLTEAELAAISALNSPDARLFGDPATNVNRQDPADMLARGML